MISFIVIGKNEGNTLEMCFQRIIESIKINQIEGAEILYIDSNSNDNSLKIALNIDFIKISVFKLTGKCNAAIARNAGADESINEKLIFLDGDMEVQSDFVREILKTDVKKEVCITGHLIDYMYDVNYNFLEVKNRTFNNIMPKKIQVLDFNGGAFYISKQTWSDLKGMNTLYDRSQDIEFSVKLRSYGIKILRIPLIMAKHHTIDYRNEDRMWSDLKKGYFYYEALLLRKNLLNKIVLKRILRSRYTSFLLFVLLLSFFLNKDVFAGITVTYVLISSVRVFKNTHGFNTSKNKLFYIIERIAYQVIRDFLFWIYLFFIFEKRQNSQYKRIS